MNSLFVDTSGWIEIFGIHNPLHKDAREILDVVIEERRLIITTNYVISEFVAIGCDKCNLTRGRLFAAIDNILNLPNIEIVHVGKESRYNHIKWWMLGGLSAMFMIFHQASTT